MNKKHLLLFAICFVSLNVLAQKQIYESPKLRDAIKQHKIVAIIPFKVTISYKKQPKNFDANANHQQELTYGTKIQTSMYTFLLRKANNYTVEFQDVEKTNILLRQNGVYDKLDETTKDVLAKILGVDAIISGDFNVEQTKSEAAAIGLMVLTGGFGGKTGDGNLILNIHNGVDGELLWRFTKTMNEGISTATDDLIEHMMRKVSRNFPYDN
jgi:hypothetical protein